MGKQIGVSIYPEHSTIKEIKAYLDLAAKYNVKKVFSCLLSVTKPVEEIKKEFKEINAYTVNLGMELMLDVSPRVFSTLGISYDDLSFFSDISATGIRLDMGFDGVVEAKMTHNPYGLDIEINMSNDVAGIDNIMSYRPNTDRLIGCHNFYPQEYTGLRLSHFMSCSERFKKFNLKTSAFVSAPSAKIGPWPVMDGLVTLEMHRRLPLTAQAKHLFATGLIDTVIIGNMYASEEELKALSEIDPDIISLEVEFAPGTTELEKDIVLNSPHFNRGDINDYMIRSTMSRVVYKDRPFPIHDVSTLSKGDIIIGNDLFGQYKGELQLCINDLPEDGRKNCVARIIDAEIFLIDYIKAWDRFKFIEKK
ncbi:hypothetical protein AwErysi_00190 [Erysipelotrichaceae bacterium]|nr:hypothetical protein AwErysi_00190 [Erysipelotrichaceae bacterium]